MKKKILAGFIIAALGASLFTGCGSNKADSSAASAETGANKEVTFGACPGPYGDMIKYAIQPGLEEKGYTVKIVEFSDYVQPNLALSRGEIDANLFQHNVYFESFIKEHNLELTAITNVPTAGLGFYSNKYKSLDELPDGFTLTVPNDVTNLRRSLLEAQKAGLLTVDETVEAAKFSEKNVTENPRNIVISPIDAAQLPRSLDNAELAAIPGNYAIAANIDLSTALYTEELAEDMKNVLAIRTSDKDSDFAKDVLEVVESEAFKEAIESSDYYFSTFQKPEWYVEKWGE